MTINEMFDELENKVRDTYIVTLKYKYEFEEKYTIENQILVYDSKADSYVWQNDWNEGQTDVEVLGYMLLGDVDTTKVEPCEDCVSREALKEKKIYSEERHEYIVPVAEIDWLPSVKPQRPKGKWISHKEHCKELGVKPSGLGWYWWCSKCDFGLDNNQLRYANYCPNCGAKMGVEE